MNIILGMWQVKVPVLPNQTLPVPWGGFTVGRLTRKQASENTSKALEPRGRSHLNRYINNVNIIVTIIIITLLFILLKRIIILYYYLCY